MATDFVWDNTANPWASDHWGRGGVAPKWPGDTGSSNADTITILGSTLPTTGPDASGAFCRSARFGPTGSTGGTLDLTNLTIGDIAHAYPEVPVVTGDEDTDGLLAIKSRFIKLQFAAAQSPNPTFSVHGHSYSLTEYQEFLVRSIAAVNRLLQSQDPFMLHSVGIT